jgi:uncharacterized 2Fe-2S/4Fe-4S cluster protein (DUF4445 family)
VDAIAASLEAGLVEANGRVLSALRTLSLCDGIELTQADVRELQLAKGAVAAALHVLLERAGANMEDIRHMYLAGAFGNYVRVSSAARIGLIPFADEDRIVPVGNSAFAGARMALFGLDDKSGIEIEHVPLNADRISSTDL